jgi:hypothetical protein
MVTVMKLLVQYGIGPIAFLFISTAVVGQSRFLDSLDVNAGLSSNDNINVGLRYGFGQNNIGVNVGTALPEVKAGSNCS